MTGEEPAETVQFVLDGQVYKIALDERNAARLRALLAPYQRVAHPIPWPGKPVPLWIERRDYLMRIREWARWHGHDVSASGPISQSVRSLYDDAHRPGSATGER